MEAFRRAASMGVGIETDLRTDADGTVILFHDRIVGGHLVINRTRDEISKALKYQVPTLAEFLEEDWQVPINFDVKTPHAFDRARRHLEVRAPADMLITAFDHAISYEAAHAGYEAGYLSASAPHRDEVMTTAANRLSTAVWQYDVVSRVVVSRARSSGMRTIVYGPVTYGEHMRLHAMEVDGVITDHPDLALAAMNPPGVA